MQSVGMLVGGTGAAQAITLLVLPVISRIYTPSEYGEFSTLLVSIGLATIIATLQMQHAVVLPKSDSQALHIFSAGLVMVVVTALLMFPITLVVMSVIGRQSSAIVVAVLVAGITFAISLGQLLQGLGIRYGIFSSIAQASVLRSGVIAALQCYMGWLGYGVNGLLLACFVGEISLAFFLWRSLPLPRKHIRTIFRSRTRLIVVARQYRDFGQFGVPQELLSSLSQGLPVLILGAGYGQAVAGAYAMVMRVLGAPVQLIGNAVRQVIYREFAGKSSGAEKKRVFVMATLCLAIPALTAAALLSPFLPSLIPAALGDDWIVAGQYSVPLVFLIALSMSNPPAGAIFRVARRQKLNLLYNLILMVSRLAALYLAAIYLSSVAAVSIYAAVSVAMNVVYIFLGYQIVKSLN
ncbi:oligosaccharide flippase family protein [Thermomonas sp. RSS23]|uniref:Oligosaccharide flippase family protein n=1 Tax=Thermomonas beijingensis TaxID=2872701 RepID=A0ABS7TCL1_9GAMM|nr:oligosaccharide flippase family protein [Thermomonas beijingensis]MBZ4185590.1 oligosaccharide flippase family protein [Thermomonas beijingensis]